MLFCSICSTTFNATGAVMLDMKTGSDVETFTRRLSRRATLDGGANITDGGFFHADRTFSVVAVATPATVAALRSMIQTAQRVTVAVREGVFSGALASASVSGTELTLSILIIGKLSA